MRAWLWRPCQDEVVPAPVPGRPAVAAHSCRGHEPAGWWGRTAEAAEAWTGETPAGAACPCAHTVAQGASRPHRRAWGLAPTGSRPPSGRGRALASAAKAAPAGGRARHTGAAPARRQGRGRRLRARATVPWLGSRAPRWLRPRRAPC
jgi:hypothetical protein